MATTIAPTLRAGRPRALERIIDGRSGITRRQLQIGLGLLWLLDGVLQAQPFMFTRGFATQVIAAGGQGQPGFVAVPVHWVSTVIAAHPVAWNLPFAAFQILLGVGLLVRRTARPALAASIAWALGVWYFGEGLSGLASGHASLTTGAPGSALLLAILGCAAWPSRAERSEGPAPWLPFAWAVVWVGAAVFQALPQNRGTAVPSELLVTAEYLIGVGALVRSTRVVAAALGLALALLFWMLGQHLGQLTSGQAPDPNSGPALALMAIALMPLRRPLVNG
jgi:hypothetical protein